jgi:antirestriction protein ArdC
MPSQTDIRQQITDQIITALRSGNLPPWKKPWKSLNGPHCNVVSRRSYTGVNPLLLEISSQRFDFTSTLWGTFKQWTELGGKVKKRPADVKPGAWGTTIVFTKKVTKTTTDSDGTESEDKFWVLRTYTVFNLDQVEGPFDHLRATVNEQSSTFEQFEQADELIDATGADIRKGSQAAYIPSGDYITLPPKESFDSAADFAETAFHELAHWTEPPNRLNWDRKGEGYAMGELRAEIAACYVATELGIPHSERLDKSAAYVQHWLRALANDNRAIFRASSQASRAADYLLSFVRTSEDQPAPSESQVGTC